MNSLKGILAFFILLEEGLGFWKTPGSALVFSQFCAQRLLLEMLRGPGNARNRTGVCYMQEKSLNSFTIFPVPKTYLRFLKNKLYSIFLYSHFDLLMVSLPSIFILNAKI